MRPNRFSYRDNEGKCHGNEPVYVDTEVEGDGELLTYLDWPHTDDDSFCRHYIPTEHAELNAPGNPDEIPEGEETQ